jgi:hypothetical protein
MREKSWRYCLGALRGNNFTPVRARSGPDFTSRERRDNQKNFKGIDGPSFWPKAFTDDVSSTHFSLENVPLIKSISVAVLLTFGAFCTQKEKFACTSGNSWEVKDFATICEMLMRNGVQNFFAEVF